jgi:acyl-CoA reductase-like NAD-dependent aldehyde dehydrogenase
MTFESINPTNEQVIHEYPEFTASEIADVVASAWQGFRANSETEISERQELLRALASLLRANRDEFAAIITAEMGKLTAESRAEIEKSADACHYLAEELPALLADLPIEGRRSSRWVAYEPIGPVLAVMPWNYPIWQVVRSCFPAMAAGNSIVLKHAANVTGCAFLLERLVADAGWPPGTLRVVVKGPEVVETLLADPRVAGVTLTGSEAAGAAVSRIAGANLKRSVMELGGSDAFVVLDDADIDAAVGAAIISRFGNCGQSCIAAKRFLIDDSIADDFEEAFIASAATLVAGDPTDDATNLGPMARRDLRDHLCGVVAMTESQGAKVALGGHVLDRPGFFLAPTVLTAVTSGMAAVTTETFGPVAVIQRIDGIDEVITAANDSPYGLSLSVWGRDTERALSVARRIQTGMAFVNMASASDPRVPFGGVKRSGYGRELGPLGIKEFANARSYSVDSRPTDRTDLGARSRP